MTTLLLVLVVGQYDLPLTRIASAEREISIAADVTPKAKPKTKRVPIYGRFGRVRGYRTVVVTKQTAAKTQKAKSSGPVKKAVKRVRSCFT